MSLRICLLALVLTLSSTSVFLTPVNAALPGVVDGEPLPSLAPMIERVTPAVVNIATFTQVRVRNPLLEDPFFRRFFNIPEYQRPQRRTQSAGSGVIIDAQAGYIVTNQHVIDRADEIEVTLSDGRVLTAELVGADDEVDLAVLKVPADDLTDVAVADSNALRVGDFAVAIGNPFGLDHSVTSGIISGLRRTGLGIEGFEDFIQTDASINPGNSGGALVNLAGDLIGINTAILAPAGGNIGIGFAIPANMVMAIMRQLVEYGEVRRGTLGVEVQALDEDLIAAFNLPAVRGVLVSGVNDKSAAAAAGILPGDIITRFDGQAVADPAQLRNLEGITSIDREVEIEIVRGDETLTLPVQTMRPEAQRIAGGSLSVYLDGAVLADLLSSDGQGRGIGIIVADVERGSVAARYGLRPNDVIIEVNRRAVDGVQGLAEVIRGRPGARLLLRVYRGGRTFFLSLR